MSHLPHLLRARRRRKRRRAHEKHLKHLRDSREALARLGWHARPRLTPEDVVRMTAPVVTRVFPALLGMR